MGLDASVMCKCLFGDKVAEPPVPLDWLYSNGDGYIDVVEEHDSDEVQSKVAEWMCTACPHPGMVQACEHVSNWSGLRAFKWALDRAGQLRFPTLHHEFFGESGNYTLPAVAARALPELARFRSLGEMGHKTCLVDSATGDLLCVHLGYPPSDDFYMRVVIAADGVYRPGGQDGLEVGVDPAGLYVRHKGICLFRSLRCRQTMIPDTSGDVVELEDLDGGGNFRGSAAIYRFVNQEPPTVVLPAELHVEPRVVTPRDFEYILDSLERLFRASVETGNPVRWG